MKVNVDAGNVHMEGPKGKLDVKIPHGITVDYKEDKLTITRASNLKQNRANHGTIRANLANTIIGLTDGHKKELEIQGIGFRAQLQGKKVVFNLGLSHPIEYDIPEDVKVAVPNQTSITVEGPDKVRVGEIAAKIRAIKPAEPYKGKGIRYLGENILRKQGKSVAK